MGLIMDKNSGNHVIKDNTTCDIRVRHSRNACRSPNGEGRGGGERGSSGISSDGVDRRIFLGLKFSIPGFSWVGKFGKYFFLEGEQKLLRVSGRFELYLPSKMYEGNTKEIDLKN